MTTTFDGKVAPMINENIKHTGHIIRIGGLDTASWANLLLLSIPNGELLIIVGVMESRAKGGRKLSALYDGLRIKKLKEAQRVPTAWWQPTETASPD
jgi:hypothetical protein